MTNVTCEPESPRRYATRLVWWFGNSDCETTIAFPAMNDRATIAPSLRDEDALSRGKRCPIVGFSRHPPLPPALAGGVA